MSRLSFAEAADRVKSGLDIVDVVQRYVILKKSGRNFTGKCPFHNDNSPSMQISRDKGIFKCFACGVGGDTLTFLMKIENRTYGEVIRELAEAQGLDIAYEGRAPEAESAQRDARQKILELNQAAARWFSERLRDAEGRVAMDYLSGRYPDENLRREALQQFQLGYAPAGWENLTPCLKRDFDFVQANPDLLESAGLSNHREHRQGQYDRFRHRLMIPIHDDKGQVVAFGGRALTDDEKPKYLNSPETAVYRKSHILYGLHQARESIRQRKAAVLMEGYFDVISAHLDGVTEAVGSCGTAMTESHLKLLVRAGAETLYLAFDSDAAGVKAALSAITLIEPHLETSGLQLKVLAVPDGKDPDAFIRLHGGTAFRALMDHAPYYLTFRFDTALRECSTDTSEGRIRAASRVTSILSGIRQPTVLAEYARYCAERIGVSEESLLLEVKRYRQLHRIGTERPGGYFENVDRKKAISPRGPTSFKRIETPLTDHVPDLRAKLSSRQIVVEQTLLRLALYNVESLDFMLRFFESQSPFSFETPAYGTILEGLTELTENLERQSENSSQKTDLSTNGFLGTLMDKMNHLYFDRPDVLHTFAELTLTAEDYGRSLGLEALSGTAFREKLTLLATQQFALLAESRKREQLRRLKADVACRDIGEQIELTYQFHNHLVSDTRSR